MDTILAVKMPMHCEDCKKPSYEDDREHERLILRHIGDGLGMYEVRCVRCWTNHDDVNALQLILDRLQRQPIMLRNLKAILDGVQG